MSEMFIECELYMYVYLIKICCSSRIVGNKWTIQEVLFEEEYEQVAFINYN